MSSPSPEYSQALEHFNQANLIVEKLQKTEDMAIRIALGFRDQLENFRRQQLKGILDARGLARCETVHITETDPEKKLGLFPKEQTKIYFESRYFTDQGEEDLPKEFSKGYRLQRLCLDHFSRGERGAHLVTLVQIEYFGSEVIEQDGKLVTVLKNQDVTALGARLDKYFPEKVYTHFGLPELPKIAEHESEEN